MQIKRIAGVKKKLSWISIGFGFNQEAIRNKGFKCPLSG